MRASLLCVCCVALVSAVFVPRLQGESPRARAAADAGGGEYRQSLDRYCVRCHNDRQKTAGLALDRVDLMSIREAAPIWEKVHGKLREGAMPPPGLPRPSQHDSE